MKPLYTIPIILFAVGTLFPVFAMAKTGSENIFYYYPNIEGYQSVEEHYRDIDILAPQIYTVGHDLELGEAESEDILDLAEDKNIDVMPLVVNADFSKHLMSRILQDEDAQDDIIDDLIDEAQDRDFIGWQFDFENINHLERDLYTDFVEKAYEEFQDEDLILSVAVIPGTAAYDPDGIIDWSSGYNIPDLADHSDFISVMSYDDPRSTGPVSSMTYLQNVMDHLLQDTPHEKISLGIPFYCWQYEVGNPKKIANVTYEISANTQEKYKDNGAGSIYLGGSYQTEFFAFIKDTGKINYIFCDNVQSLKAKQEFINDNELRGFSAWALGQEDERIWEEL